MGTARKNNGIMIRIGVIMGGQLVEERKFNTAHISVGELDRCTIVAPGCGYSRLELFERTATGYKLVPTAAKLAACATGCELWHKSPDLPPHQRQHPADDL